MLLASSLKHVFFLAGIIACSFAAHRADAASQRCDKTLPTPETMEGCGDPRSVKIRKQTLADGTVLLYQPICVHGADVDYRVFKTASNCALTPLSAESYNGGTLLENQEVTCGDIAFTSKPYSLRCTESDTPRGYTNAKYVLEGTVLRLEKAIYTDIETDKKRTLYKRKPPNAKTH